MNQFRLPAELCQTIFRELSKDDILNLSQVSQATRMQCEPVIFHRITLGDGKKRAFPISSRVLKRLEDPNDNLVYSVRHVTVGYASTGAILPQTSLVRAICNIKALESLTWRTWMPITEDILESLHSAHPCARLSVVARKRNNLPLDRPLLLSPQLHTLDIELGALYDKNLKKPMGQSELNYLKTLLVQSNNLKVLRVRFTKIKCGSKAARSIFPDYTSSSDASVSLHFEDGERFPALEELALQDFYSWQDDTTLAARDCEMWKNHQDWSNMRKLDLRLHGGHQMLRNLIGEVPLLHTLKIKMNFDIPLVEMLRAFLQSVHHLRHLHLECDSQMDPDLFQSLCGTIPRHLVSLYVKADCNFRKWYRGRFVDLLLRCPQLQALAMDGYKQQIFGTWMGAEADMSPGQKLERLVRTAKHHSSSSSRTFPVYSFQYGVVQAPDYWWIPIQRRVDWLGYTDGEDFEAIQERSQTDKCRIYLV